MEEQKINYFANYKKSSFDENGIDSEVELIKSQIKDLYLSDSLPWVIGYSGGKDSTACLQLIWYAIKELPPEQRKKTFTQCCFCDSSREFVPAHEGLCLGT
jgi:3'-phosphoadenosine 5'-phosphosulfate sulfotransferase (PAPS reductase)/FAD synthetase